MPPSSDHPATQPTWTRETVCAALVAAFRRPQSAYLATPGEVELALNWRIRVPQLAAQDWRYLVAWGRARAGGESMSAMCAAHGWNRSTADDGWRRAADMIAATLNAEEVNAAESLAGSAAHWRLWGRAANGRAGQALARSEGSAEDQRRLGEPRGPRQVGSPGTTMTPATRAAGGAPTRRLLDRAG